MLRITSSPRLWEHKTGVGSKFAAKYKIDRRAYYEVFHDIRNAINREKEIKGWLRIKKIALIVSMNPTSKGLSEEWYKEPAFLQTNA